MPTPISTWALTTVAAITYSGRALVAIAAEQAYVAPNATSGIRVHQPSQWVAARNTIAE